ncbi:hypothetical protein [Geothrix sp. 21YS21S-4]|uniref:hypothetical protein n=1 Tax=Geothrix sp. 21YS21S-4 TaxID=3068889 RepID=UPI0027B9B6BE|nr:hypothetical protein [Geothrix sp. 21YS21S-4]
MSSRQPSGGVPRRGGARVRRWVAALLLCLMGLYLGAAGREVCPDTSPAGCAPACHLLCGDDCATAPVPEAPVPPPAPRRLHPRFAVPRAQSLVSLTVEPEKEPPRA